MRNLNFAFLRKNLNNSLLALFAIALLFSCKKDEVVVVKQPVISYSQKIISLAEDMAMTPLRPDSTGGVITEYSVSPSLPKGIVINKLNGVISGTPSDTLLPVKFIVTATGPGGIDTDTLMISVGTVAFNYGAGTFTIEKGANDISTTPISPVILAGTFNQFFVSPYPDSINFKTGLNFNPTTGQISGVPTKLTSTTEVPTPATFTITGISTSNKAASTTISIIVNDKKPNFTYTFRGSFTVGTSISTNLQPVVNTTTGGAIKKFRLASTSIALPAGLTLDSLNGSISGTPTAAVTGTLVIRGINTGGFQDVSLPLIINSTAVAPEVVYMMSLFSGNVTDTISPRIASVNTIYLTKNDNIGAVQMFLNPVVTTGQTGTFSIAPAFVSGIANENMSLTTSNGSVSGTPGQFTTNSTPSHTLTINNAVTGGPSGSFAMNIVANAPFFTYNGNGKGGIVPNAFAFVQNQSVGVANGIYPGYTAAELAPVNGAGVTSYAIYPATATTQPFSATGLTFNTTTGAISGTPTSNTFNFNYTFWDYVVVGKKADGSFTVYKIRFKIYMTPAVWGS